MGSVDACADARDCAMFGDEISDQALERAACVAKDGTPNLTIAFCSGLDECPPHTSPRRRAVVTDL